MKNFLLKIFTSIIIISIELLFSIDSIIRLINGEHLSFINYLDLFLFGAAVLACLCVIIFVEDVKKWLDDY